MLKLVGAFGGRWQSKLDSAALTLGLVGNICLAFLFFPVTRGSSLLPLFGLTSENSIKYHIWLGNITMTLFTTHGICFIIYWAVTNELSQVIKNLYFRNQLQFIHEAFLYLFFFFLIIKDIHFFYGVFEILKEMRVEGMKLKELIFLNHIKIFFFLERHKSLVKRNESSYTPI